MTDESALQPGQTIKTESHVLAYVRTKPHHRLIILYPAKYLVLEVTDHKDIVRGRTPKDAPAYLLEPLDGEHVGKTIFISQEDVPAALTRPEDRR